MRCAKLILLLVSLFSTIFIAVIYVSISFSCSLYDLLLNLFLCDNISMWLKCGPHCRVQKKFVHSKLFDVLYAVKIMVRKIISIFFGRNALVISIDSFFIEWCRVKFIFFRSLLEHLLHPV